MATPAAAYGAMLAGVDVVLMGAGIPREIPRLLDQLAAPRGRPAAGGGRTVTPPTTGTRVHLDPRDLLGADLPPLTRPMFLAIVSAHVLAAYLARDEHIRPDGFVVEGPLAGGHNAPPRGRLTVDALGQPVFGPRDEADLGKIAALGLPFWLAGVATGHPRGSAAALAAGAAGVQVGTLFALSDDSGLDPALRSRLVGQLRDGTLDVRTDAAASPTGFPFKVAQLSGTLSDPDARADRPRLCDLGYLRTPYQRDGGAVGYRCPAEPVHVYLRKGGAMEDTVGRACLCNSAHRQRAAGPDQARRLPGGAVGDPRRRRRGRPAAGRGAPLRVVRRGCRELAAGGPSALTPSQARLYRPGHEPRRAPAGRPRHGGGPVPQLSPAGPAARRSRRERPGASAARPGGRRGPGQTRHLRHVRGQRPVPTPLPAAGLREGAGAGLGVPRAAARPTTSTRR